MTFEDVQNALPPRMSGSMILSQRTWVAKFWTRRQGQIVDDYTIMVWQRPKETPDDCFRRGLRIAKATADALSAD